MTERVVMAWYDELYTRLGNDVLVVLGPPGAGKSGALLLLMLEALRRRHQQLSRKSKVTVPVPVWITCGSWNPETMTFAEHVVEVLTRDCPGLTSTDLGGRAAPLALIDHGHLAVFLDGLDEMPPSLRTAALGAIMLQAGRMPVVLTSRTDKYRTAVSSGRFRPAAVIELRPVDADAATAYLTDRQSAARVSAWRPVLDQIRNEPDSALSKVLSTPLGLALARDTATLGARASAIHTAS
jgi:predicted NACHT family NTPase